jgi:hypothetical protein
LARPVTVKACPTVADAGGAPAAKVTEVGFAKQVLGLPLVGPPQYWPLAQSLSEPQYPTGWIVTFTDTLPSAANPDISSTYAVAVKVAPPATSPAVGV